MQMIFADLSLSSPPGQELDRLEYPLPHSSLEMYDIYLPSEFCNVGSISLSLNLNCGAGAGLVMIFRCHARTV